MPLSRSEPSASTALLDAAALDLLFREARTVSTWLDKPVPDDLLRAVYDLASLGPTSNNSNPMRVVFVTSREGKERLRPALRPSNVAKTMAAPVTAIVGSDLCFFEHLPRLFPRDPNRAAPYAADPELASRTAFRNASLQGAYLMIAARALGLDCGPMSGFDHRLVDEAFLSDGTVTSNFLINLGYGDRAALPPRLPRLSFEEACTIV